MRRLWRRVARAGLSTMHQWWLQVLERGTRPAFANEPIGFEMRWPRSLVHPERMTIGRDVKLGPNSELKCSTRYPGGWMTHPRGEHVTQSFEPRLVIGDRVTATASLQVVAFASVVIEDDVMFAANVYVGDGTHAFAAVDVPFKFQGIGKLGPIRVGRGSWIGQNAVITPGVTIGEMAIVAANSVVTRDVAPRTIVGGAPAKVLSRWDDRLERLERYHSEGN